MAHDITGLDHALLAVRDLAGAGRAFARLGFTPCPRGGHAEWGTANHCLMFPDDYVELLAGDGAGPGADRVRAHLESRGEGLMGVALGSRDAARSSQSLQRAGVAAGPPRPLSRGLMTPEGECLPRFNTVDLPGDALPGLPAFLCQHLTPELLRRPEWLDHPNGACAIASVTVLDDDPEGRMAAYNRVFGPAASTPTDQMVTVHTGRGLIFLVTPDGFDDLHPLLDLALPTAPAAIVLAIRVRDIGRTAQVLKANGIHVDCRGRQLAVDPADSLGVGLEFIEG